MRDINGIDKVIERLKPHMTKIEEHFNVENARFIELMAKPHDVLGRLLKCHLVVEHYMERFITEHYGIQNITEVKLSFFN